MPKSAHDDYFVHPGDGLVVISNFDLPSKHGSNQSGDYLTFDTGHGVYDGILPNPFDDSPTLYDGEVFYNSNHSDSFTVTALDYNGDGHLDTQIVDSEGDGFVLLGVQPSQVFDYQIFGG